jgi:Filamin/ABP280 repeat/Calponin homology (CH) domain
MHIDDMEHDFKNGVKLCALLEIISDKKMPMRINQHPRVPAQKLENCGMAIQFIGDEGLKLVNIGAEDIVDGRLKLILGLIWTLILRYQINMGEAKGAAGENDLLQWVRSKIPEYDIKNFQKDWNDGRAICALVDALRPGYCPDHQSLDPNNKLANCQKGIDTAWERMDVAPLIHSDEMSNPRVDKLAMMTYISQFRNLSDAPSDASKCQAYGEGLEEGVVNQESKFFVQTPGRGKLDVKVEGPSTTAQASVKDVGDGKYEVVFTPTEPGTWKVHVTLDGTHIPGSIFTVNVLEEESLGGEGKFRVFYSTTASSNKGRTDVFGLQTLLEAKKIHERPDFEPFIPVDILERDDREAIFRKAGTRALPIVIIDDVVVGDYDALVDLNETGTLDKILSHGISGAGREFLKSKTMFGGGAAVPSNAAPVTRTVTPGNQGGQAAAAPAAAASGGPAAFCPKCGVPNASKGNFCAGCGNKLN